MKQQPLFGPKCGPSGHYFHPTVARLNFRAGEVYLFHRSDSRCPESSSLWGQYKHYGGRFYLESSSGDLRRFVKWHILPPRYRYCRRASRSEFRDYLFALSWSESRSLSPPSSHTCNS